MRDQTVILENGRERIRGGIRRTLIRAAAQAEPGGIVAQEIHVHAAGTQHGGQPSRVVRRIIHVTQRQYWIVTTRPRVA